MSDQPETAPKSGFFVYVVPAALYVVAIFYGGLTPHAPGPGIKNGDKLMHAIAFGFMQLVVWRAVRFEAPSRALRRQLILAFVIVAALGGALEIAQMATDTRSAELADWIADLLGAGSVALIAHRVLRTPRDAASS